MGRTNGHMYRQHNETRINEDGPGISQQRAADSGREITDAYCRRRIAGKTSVT
jgi:hypothetical protein